MDRLLEILLGLDKGFLSREGELSLQFNPHWPWQDVVGAGLWNFLLIGGAIVLLIYVYRRDGRSRGVRLSLGAIRACLLAVLIALLNRPVLTLGQSQVEPSVLAVMIDDSVSMRVRDAGVNASQPVRRIDAAVDLFNASDQALLKELSKQHTLRFYKFDRDAQPVGSLDAEGVKSLDPQGQSTQVARSIRSVLDDLQGQRVAGVVVLTDGRDTPASPADALAAVKNFGVKVFPIAIGSDRSPSNIEIQSVNAQDNAFKGDIVGVKIVLRGTGFKPSHAVKLVLKDKKTGQMLVGADGKPAETTIELPDDRPLETELQFKPADVGPLDVVVEAVKQAGEIDDEDNLRNVQVAVLDAKIAVLYVDGYPRWEYRYLKNELIRDRTIDLSCLLTSADPNFAQEGDKPITRFPESIEEMLDYDVVVLGDVDPRQFTDNQLMLINEFVSRKGGGFGMIAGPRWSPQAWRNTAIEPILPVNISHVVADEDEGNITQGFRPVLTRVGAGSSIFRFFADKATNEKFLRDQIQPIFWYCRGPTVKNGVGETYAEHPTETGPDGRKAVILVLGRYGAGRTLFSAIDDSWRWRFYTGESIFDTYWVQQLRYLARSKKLGQRRVSLTSLRPGYELGEQVRLNLRILDPQLQQQLPEQLRVQIVDGGGQTTRIETLTRQEGQADLYSGSFAADRVGKFVAKLPPIAGGVDTMELPIEVSLPRLELASPQVDRTALSRLASETLGRSIELADAPKQLLAIPSAAKVIPVQSGQPLWDAPLAMALFVLLISAEWITRKVFGMV